MCAKCTQIVTQNLLLRRMYFRLNISVADAVSPSSRFMCNLQWLQLFQTHGLNNDEENKLKLWIVAGLKLSSRKIEKKRLFVEEQLHILNKRYSSIFHYQHHSHSRLCSYYHCCLFGALPISLLLSYNWMEIQNKCNYS